MKKNTHNKRVRDTGKRDHFLYHGSELKHTHTSIQTFDETNIIKAHAIILNIANDQRSHTLYLTTQFNLFNFLSVHFSFDYKL